LSSQLLIMFVSNKTALVTLWPCDPVTLWPCDPGPPRYRGFTHTKKHPTLFRTSLDELSAWRRSVYLTSHNNHNRQTYSSRRTSNLQSQQASCFRPRGHWNRHTIRNSLLIFSRLNRTTKFRTSPLN
jgi:hypothetical protein